jgi:hypothetical protein
MFVSDPQRLQFLFKSMWDYIFSVEILRREYMDQNALRILLRRLLGDRESREIDLLLQLSLSKDSEGETFSSKLVDLIQEIELSVGQEAGNAAVHAKLDSAPLKVGQVKLLQMIANVSKKLPDHLRLVRRSSWPSSGCVCRSWRIAVSSGSSRRIIWRRVSVVREVEPMVEFVAMRRG